EAVQISSLLFQIKKKMCTMTIEELRDWGIKKLQANPLFRVDYLEIVDKRTLHALTSWKEKENGMVCAAVYVGDVRLIDNLELF
ncbi:MAG: pantoate--beta-alanine ligase, partial [Syntrophothermus sp.]